jgi:hypothetical protein
MEVNHDVPTLRHPELVSGSYFPAVVAGIIKMLKQVQHDDIVFVGMI